MFVAKMHLRTGRKRGGGDSDRDRDRDRDNERDRDRDDRLPSRPSRWR